MMAASSRANFRPDRGRAARTVRAGRARPRTLRRNSKTSRRQMLEARSKTRATGCSRCSTKYVRGRSASWRRNMRASSARSSMSCASGREEERRDYARPRRRGPQPAGRSIGAANQLSPCCDRSWAVTDFGGAAAPRATALSWEHLVSQFVKRPPDPRRVESRGRFSFAGVLGVDDRFPEVPTIPHRIHAKSKL
jgi:hypothetical protein